jgi:hypothetical protein
VSITEVPIETGEGTGVSPDATQDELARFMQSVRDRFPGEEVNFA